MKKPKKKEPTIISRVLLFLVVVALVVAVVYNYHRMRRPIIPNVCPIDGQVAEWSKRQGRRDCEYGHFSAVEKQQHTWVADCP